jgi:hypothetical protein
MAGKAPSALVTEVPTPTGEEKQKELDMMDIMREHFAAQPKILVKTKTDALVQVNGYTFLIKANDKVAVPEEIGDMLEVGGYI